MPKKSAPSLFSSAGHTSKSQASAILSSSAPRTSKSNNNNTLNIESSSQIESTSSERLCGDDLDNNTETHEFRRLMSPKSLHHDPISAKGNGSPKKVNPRYVKSKEAKVQKSATMTSSNLQPSTTTPTTVMSLRPRGIF